MTKAGLAQNLQSKQTFLALAPGEVCPAQIGTTKSTSHHGIPKRSVRQVCLADLPPPDLLIRTSGELRISNFLLWQCAYAEFYFTDVYWPDFDGAELDKAFTEFYSRQRRYGLREEQLAGDA